MSADGWALAVVVWHLFWFWLGWRLGRRAAVKIRAERATRDAQRVWRRKV